MTESTTVRADSPLVRTDSSEVGTVIEQVAVKELPLNLAPNTIHSISMVVSVWVKHTLCRR